MVHSKNPKGTVVVISSNDRLQLRFSYAGRRHYLSLGLTDTPEHRKLAEAKAKLIESDIVYERFDPTLNRYKPQSQLSIATEPPKTVPTLGELWERYLEYRRPQVAETTFKLNYARVTSHIKKLPTRDLKDAVTIRDYLLQQNSAYTAKRIITQLSACCDWALKSKLTEDNPFDGMASEIKVKRIDGEDIDPFTREERDAIIAAFEAHPVYTNYTNFVRFLFWTGCRTSEAVALKWKHISPDFRIITFSEATVCVSSHKVQKSTKTGKIRRFPCNRRMQDFLQSIKPENAQPDSLVFPSPKGKAINAHTFNTVWKGHRAKGKYHQGVVTQLVEEGKVSHYRPQYNTRHTFITYALLEGVSVPQVAKWVGNSPEIILKHYAGVRDTVQVPEF